MPEAEREIARAEADQLAWRDLVRDELRSIRTTMALLGALGVVALGIAVWALLSGDSDGAPRSDASTARVSELERRLEDVRSEVERTPSSSAIASLRARQQALEKQIADALRRMEQTSGEVRAIEQRVDDLEHRSPTQAPAGTP